MQTITQLYTTYKISYYSPRLHKAFLVKKYAQNFTQLYTTLQSFLKQHNQTLHIFTNLCKTQQHFTQFHKQSYTTLQHFTQLYKTLKNKQKLTTLQHCTNTLANSNKHNQTQRICYKPIQHSATLLHNITQLYTNCTQLDNTIHNFTNFVKTLQNYTHHCTTLQNIRNSTKKNFTKQLYTTLRNKRKASTQL